MKTLQITHFLDVIKKEVSESEPISSAKNNESDSKFHIKHEYIEEEIDIPWDETSYVVKKEKDDIFSEKSINMFRARVVIDKLPESIVQKYSKSKMKTIDNYENSNEECVSSIVPTDFITNSSKSSRHEISENKANPKKKIDSGFYWNICEKCNVKKHESICCIGVKNECDQCKSRLIFKCEKCHKQLGTIKCMRAHVRSECGQKGRYYKCFQCDFKASYLTSVKRHVKKMHPTMTSKMHCIEKIKSYNIQNDLGDVRCKKFNCSKCEKKFEYLPIFVKHVQNCTGKKDANYEYSQSTDKELRINIRNRIMFYCEKCDKDVMYHKELRETKTRKIECPVCKTFMAFKCLECKKQYNSKEGVSSHIKTIHSDKREYKCSECIYETSNFIHLCNHYRYMHISRIHECSRCGKKFDKRNMLYRHLQQCGLEPQYHCDNCTFKSHYRNYFICHVMRHMPGNEIDCPTCKLTLKNKFCFQAHKRRCGKRPNMKCDHCSYKSNDKRTLIKHISRIHTIEKKNKVSYLQENAKK